MSSATLIYNPFSGRQDQRDWLPEIVPAWKRAGWRLEVRETGAPGAAEAIARQAADAGVDLVIAWGGDGTVNETANGLAGSDIPLGILPGGCVNVLALELGIPSDLGDACDLLIGSGRRRCHRRIRLGRVGDRYFILMAGVGLDAFLVRHVEAEQKRVLGRSAYLLGALRTAWSYRYPAITVQFEGKSLSARQMIFSNVSHYAGGWPLAPLADPTGGGLTLSLFQGKRPWNYLRYLHGIRRGHHSVYHDVLNFQGNRFRVRDGGEPVGIQLDGDYFGNLPVEIESVPDALTVVCPAGPA